jgi:hypothetical protein
VSKEMSELESSKKQIPKPSIRVDSWSIATPFYMAKEVPFKARHLLAFASNMRIHGCNIYRLMTSREIANALNFSYRQFMRMKKILKDKKLLFYDGTPGDYTKIKEAWEQNNNKKWDYDL